MPCVVIEILAVEHLAVLGKKGLVIAEVDEDCLFRACCDHREEWSGPHILAFVVLGSDLVDHAIVAAARKNLIGLGGDVLTGRFIFLSYPGKRLRPLISL